MKILLFIGLLILSFRTKAQVNTLLDIPGRLQWDNNNGYCGENALLAIGLYYGNYTSEGVVRTIAGGELLIAVNDAATFNALSYTYEEWDYNQTTPQYQNYLVWVKQHLYNKQPVIITVFIKGLNDPDYDHIIPAIGFNAANVNNYNGADQLIYNSNYDSISFTRTFSSVYDTRSMNNNGAVYDYCIPKNVNYGTAITGVKDIQHVLKPVHLKIDSWDEPNISLSETPKLLHAIVKIDSLTNGQSYALMKYVNYQNVPASNFIPQNADTCIYFTANGSSQTFNTSFMSDGTVFYRCIQYTNTSVQDQSKEETFSIFPNPAKEELKINISNKNFIEGSTIIIYNVLGTSIYEKKITSLNSTFDLSGIPSGIYYVKISGNNNCIKKLVIQ